jgi:hypothetical protein
MICKIQVVTIGDDGRKETREITSIQRTDVKPETLGLTLAEGKMILKDLQQIVVESQVSSLLLPKRTCPECGEPRCSKGNHTLSVRTVFGQLTVRSPRSGDAQPEQTGQRVSGSRAVLQFECSALVRVREPNHFRASR